MREVINIADEHKRILTKEFKVTYQTMRMALMYVNNSILAKKMRKRAKELLQEEADGVKLDDDGKQ
ncbi:MAG: hypothetical protein JEZ14_07445 [Marinilabiliaceae bacterium]|nr:hypothetical protein [Marinilabiliaceae bacterium]